MGDPNGIVDEPTAVTYTVGELTLIRHAATAGRTPQQLVEDPTWYAGGFRWLVRLPSSSSIKQVDDAVRAALPALVAIPRDAEAWTPVMVTYPVLRSLTTSYGYLHQCMFIGLGTAHARCLNCRLALMAHTLDDKCLYEPTRLRMLGGTYEFFDLDTGERKYMAVL